MQQLVMSLGVGIAAGALTCYASVWAIGYTMAFAMPPAFPIALWDALVVFGLGAGLVALAVHLLTLRLFTISATPALLGFVTGLALMLLALGESLLAGKAWAAWLLGSVAATGIAAWLRSNNSFKGMPLRGTP